MDGEQQKGCSGWSVGLWPLLCITEKAGSQQGMSRFYSGQPCCQRHRPISPPRSHHVLTKPPPADEPLTAAQNGQFVVCPNQFTGAIVAEARKSVQVYKWTDQRPQSTDISSPCLLFLWSALRELMSVTVSGGKSGATDAHANQSHVELTHCTPLATKGGVIILESITHRAHQLLRLMS